MEFDNGEAYETTEIPIIQLDEEFMKEVQVDEVVLRRGDEADPQTYSLYYVTNSIDLLNDRYRFLRFDPKVDIVKDDYEGGFKVWEGTNDLLNFLYNNGEQINLAGKNLLEIGCGCGLVGIFCLKAFELNSLYLQDYNLEVLKFSTLPNLVKNGLEEQIPRCQFIAGDWSETVEKIRSKTNDLQTELHTENPGVEKFDAIFMSEVLYNPENYLKIATIVNELLDKSGTCIISSKLYYFGVNGSVDEFKDFIENNFPQFNIETLVEIDNKMSNKREIFSLSFKSE